MSDQPAIQLIANLVVESPEARVLFVRYDPGDERWWLPGGDLLPYEHPDDAAARVLASWPGLRAERLRMARIESFRGRRGWHVVFHYHVTSTGEASGEVPAQWCDPGSWPPTVHGRWERESVDAVLSWTRDQRSSS